MSSRGEPTTGSDNPGSSRRPGQTIRVLYIGGWGRSGSTLLDRMLGQVPGVISLGEVREIWQSGLTENRPCGCGRPFRDCPFWQEVGREAFGGWDEVDVGRVRQLWQRFDRPWGLPLLMAPASWSEGRPGLRTYRGYLERLYLAIGRVSGGEVLVDSSKIPTHALLLHGVPAIDLRMVHLIRDARGVVYSWERQPLYHERYTPLSAAVRWLLYNEPTRFTRSLGIPYLLMRYEDLVADQRAKLEEALRHAGRPPSDGDLSFVREGEVVLGPNHTVDGNPMRFAVGPVRLRADDEWKHSMRAADRIGVTIVTSPSLIRHGYPLRTGGRSLPRPLHPSGPKRTERGAPGPLEAQAATGEGRVKVLYIGGLGRSGSTLLDCILGQLPGFFSAGEVRDLWQRGLRENRLCGCGSTFRQCAFWKAVAERAFGGWDRVDLDRMQRLSRRVDRHSTWPFTLVPSIWPSFRRSLEEYTDVLARLYRAIQDVAKTRVIIDSSKAPSTAFLLRRIRGVDLRAVHLVRDSRGVAYSWSKRVVRPDVPGKTVYMHRYPPVRVGLRYLTRNALMEVLGRLGVPTIRVRYETMVSSPREEVARILALLGETASPDDFAYLQDGRVELGLNHTVMGNPVRMHRGPLTLKIDDHWKSSLEPSAGRILSLLTGPLLWRYGYRP